MLRIAIIVTPMGRDLGALCKIGCNNALALFNLQCKKFCSNTAKGVMQMG
jgi:hypothetical protein